MTNLSRVAAGVGVSSANAARTGRPSAAVSGRLANGDNAASPRPSVNARRLMAWCSVITPPFAGCGYALILVTILPGCPKASAQLSARRYKSAGGRTGVLVVFVLLPHLGRFQRPASSRSSATGIRKGGSVYRPSLSTKRWGTVACLHCDRVSCCARQSLSA